MQFDYKYTMKYSVVGKLKKILRTSFIKYPNNIFDFNLKNNDHFELFKSWPFITKDDGYEPLTEAEYQDRLGVANKSKAFSAENKRAKLAFDLVVENRKFEIELYWKRATYFWAFIASTFVAYVLLARSEFFREPPTFIVICVGFILSCAWYYTNIGSKTWQRHWEKHLDLLEDPFTGPLYKTVFETNTYSVSKINVIVSNVFRAAWVGLAFHYLSEVELLHFNLKPSLIDLPILAIISVTLLALCSMKFGYGRGRFRKRDVQIYQRL